MTSGRLIDADTLDIPGIGPIRLAGIDAPENGQLAWDANGRSFDAGEAATEALGAYLKDRQRAGWQVSVEGDDQKRDRYGRVIATIYLQKGKRRENACAWLVRNGWAVAEYGPPHYRREENQARRKGVGLWAGEWERPREWRAANRGASAAASRKRQADYGFLSALSQLSRTFRQLNRLFRLFR